MVLVLLLSEQFWEFHSVRKNKVNYINIGGDYTNYKKQKMKVLQLASKF
jgi:hypothetical protein